MEHITYRQEGPLFNLDEAARLGAILIAGFIIFWAVERVMPHRSGFELLLPPIMSGLLVGVLSALWLRTVSMPVATVLAVVPVVTAWLALGYVYTESFVVWNVKTPDIAPEFTIVYRWLIERLVAAAIASGIGHILLKATIQHKEVHKTT